MNAATTTRQSAQERREATIEAAMTEFARGGLAGTSTETIARRVGVSQPYLFRLFGTKKDLFIAVVERCFQRTLEAFQLAVGRAEGGDLFRAMGEAYVDMLKSDRRRLLVQMQAYTASDDPDVREAVRKGYGELHGYVARVTGADEDQIRDFFSHGMLLNVMTAMELQSYEADWARRLLGSFNK